MDYKLIASPVTTACMEAKIGYEKKIGTQGYKEQKKILYGVAECSLQDFTATEIGKSQ